MTRLQWEPNGEPLIPGDLDTWKQILDQKTDSKVIHDWGKRAARWNSPERSVGSDGRLFPHTDGNRTAPTVFGFECDSTADALAEEQLAPQTVLLMAKQFPEFSSWYLTFSEFPELNDASIALFLKTANTIDATSD